MKSIIIIYATLLLIIATPLVFNSIDDSLTQEDTHNFANVSSSNSSATVYLGRDIYNDDTTSISSITSNATTDSPAAYSYNTASHALLVTGLDNSATDRTLEVEFLIDSTILPAGASSFLTLLRWFYIFIIFGMAGGAIYAFFQT